MLCAGIAGGVNPANNIGDVVVPQQWLQPQHQQFSRPLQDTNGTNTASYFIDSTVHMFGPATTDGSNAALFRASCTDFANTASADLISAAETKSALR